MRRYDDRGGFLISGGPRCCLLLGGFSGIRRLRGLGDALHKLGFTVAAPELFMNDETQAGNAPSKWRMWLDDARDACAELNRKYQEVHVIGFGEGGTISLVLAAQYPIASIAVIDPVVYSHDPVRLLLGALFEGDQSRKGYGDLGALVRLARRSIFAVIAPMLVVQTEESDALCERSSMLVLSGISSRDKTILRLPQLCPKCAPDLDWKVLCVAIKNHICRDSAANTLVN